MSAGVVPPEGEHLTNGWEPDAPPDDTLVRQAVLVHASWPVTVAQSIGRPWRSSARWSGGWIADRGALTNPVVLKQPPIDVGGVIGEVHELFPSHAPYLLINPWSTIDLRGHELVLLGYPPLMVRFPAPRPAADPTGVDVREVTDADGLAVAERVLVEGYPMPELEPVRRGELLGPRILDGPTRVWLAYVEGSPVAVAAAHTHSAITLVEYVAALPAARGRGAGSAVTWAATLAEPDLPAVLIASDEGRPVYERMGYRAIERWSAWLRPESPSLR